jgi:hypothetical protein
VTAVTSLDPGIEMLDRLPPEPVKPPVRFELIELCWRAAIAVPPDRADWQDRIERLAAAAWAVALSPDEPTVN